MSLRRLKVLSNYGEDTFQWWRIHPRISIGGGIRYSRYIKSASCTSCSVVPWFFSTPGCTCVRQVSIHSDFCSVGAPPPAPFSIFRFRCLLDRRKKPCRALHVAFNFLFSTIRDVFGSGWKKGRKKKKKKGRARCRRTTVRKIPRPLRICLIVFPDVTSIYDSFYG